MRRIGWDDCLSSRSNVTEFRSKAISYVLLTPTTIPIYVSGRQSSLDVALLLTVDHITEDLIHTAHTQHKMGHTVLQRARGFRHLDSSQQFVVATKSCRNLLPQCPTESSPSTTCTYTAQFAGVLNPSSGCQL